MPVLYGVDLSAAIDLKDVIGGSSQVIAACRAAESERQDALFVDPLAKYFGGYEGGTLPAYLKSYVAVRTHFIDVELMDALTTKHQKAPQGGVVPNQVVLLGAGMDARMWRLPQQTGSKPPAEVVFELDQKKVLDAKETVLAELARAGQLPSARLAKRRVTLSVDIQDPDWVQALHKAGHDRTTGTVWILEGFLRFFSNQQIDDLIKQLSLNCAPGSSILVTVPSEKSRKKRVEMDPVDAEYQWRFGTDNPVAYFSRFGWKTVHHALVTELQHEYNRVPEDTTFEGSDERSNTSWLLRAVKIA